MQRFDAGLQRQIDPGLNHTSCTSSNNTHPMNVPFPCSSKEWEGKARPTVNRQNIRAESLKSLKKDNPVLSTKYLPPSRTCPNVPGASPRQQDHGDWPVGREGESDQKPKAAFSRANYPKDDYEQPHSGKRQTYQDAFSLHLQCPYEMRAEIGESSNQKGCWQ
jgi:hypothetical protein